ncbi:DUF1190 domain-containing protein [Alkalinema sp. FACHB-956]|uniref:DUF1190 domain-containing protein n=1 Tax=Alkalinema sp. FACHB-956 TaxID=2692768 RepID=UPI00168276BA|nr:DUF1190 domain-containing protein [Alkalinema sp. FACHB-956]MBD2325681.1 DUF1190 domain-containing protein [Alkalinema sp. FACHB-956]
MNAQNSQNSQSPRSQSQASPQLRSIRRQQIQTYLAISAFIAAQLVAGCNDAGDEAAAPMVPALFYENKAQCEVDAKRQQDLYAARLKAAQAQPTAAGTPSPQVHPPLKPPALKPEDCEGQMRAARAEHDRHAPVYKSLTDCQAEGVQCEPYSDGTQSSSSHGGYRPRFGGAYIYPEGNPNSPSESPVNTGSGSRFYPPHTVYSGLNPGEVVTPNGDPVSRTSSGSVMVPAHTGFAAPSRPAGTAAKGTITGRSQSGFGSSYKSTGRGGK